MIDSSIYQNIKPIQPESQLNNLANVLKLQELQQGGQLNTLKLQEAQRGIEQQNSLRSILSGVQPNEKPESIAQRLMQGGHLKEASEYQKTNRENLKNEAATAKDMADVVTKRTEWYKNALSSVRSPQDAASWVSAQYKDQYLAPLFNSLSPEGDAIKSIPQDPTAFNDWIQKQALNMGKFIELNKPSIHMQNTGGNANVLAIPGLGGAPQTLSSTPMTQSPDSVASNARIVEEGKLNRGQSERHFNANQNTPQYMETDAGLVALPKKLGAGQSPVGTPVMGADGQPLGKPLKPVPASVNSAIIANKQAQNQLDRALTLLSGQDIGNPKEGGMQGDTAATGWKGMLPQAILNRVDPSGVATRAEIADIGSLKLHERSGAAVTISESPRLMPFIPTASDDAATVVKKLRRLKLEIDNESKAMGEFYGKDQGYRPPPSLSNQQPTQKTIVRTGTSNGRKVVQYSDGSVSYAD